MPGARAAAFSLSFSLSFGAAFAFAEERIGRPGVVSPLSEYAGSAAVERVESRPFVVEGNIKNRNDLYTLQVTTVIIEEN